MKRSGSSSTASAKKKRGAVAAPRARHILPTALVHPPTLLRAGTYVLGPCAELGYHVEAACCSDAEFEALWEQQPPAVPNPMNPKTRLRRRQGTWGASSYTFGAQTSPGLGDVAVAPVVVRRCLADAQLRAGADARLYTAVHVNWYAGGRAGLAAHQDSEASSLVGHKIYSYTFIVRDEGDGGGGAGRSSRAAAYRHFVVSRDRKQQDTVACIATHHGDLIVMGGSRFQRDFWHGVPTTSRQDMRHVRRINLTVRAWDGAAAIHDAD